MEDQDKHVDKQTNGTRRDEITQVGQVLRNLAATRHLPTPTLPQRSTTVPTVQRERIAMLIAALGDVNHPHHQQAVNDIVAIGDPAVPALSEALSPRRPWLTAFRAAEALSQIGNGRATSALIEALHHTNSNVRWSAVRALAALGDARALLQLRKVAREDRGKTSWGESVAGAAQSALDQMRVQNVLLRSTDLLKTAIACVLMLVALIVAYSVVINVRTTLRTIGHEQVPAGVVAPYSATDAAATASVGPATAAPAIAPTVVPTPASNGQVTGTVLEIANVHKSPTTTGAKIGVINRDDEVIFLAATPDKEWYRVKLSDHHAGTSQINSADGSGWVIGSLLSLPAGAVKIETPTANP